MAKTSSGSMLMAENKSIRPIRIKMIMESLSIARSSTCVSMACQDSICCIHYIYESPQPEIATRLEAPDVPSALP